MSLAGAGFKGTLWAVVMLASYLASVSLYSLHLHRLRADGNALT